MANTYFVGFLQGTSGRFVSSIIWSLLNELDNASTYSAFNSAHLDTFCSTNWITDNLHEPTGDKYCYQFIDFDGTKSSVNPKNIRLFFSHVYPDFETILARFHDAKVVVISIEENDYLEIAGNYLFKNAIEKSCEMFLNNLPERIKFFYKMLYNKECSDSHVFTESEIYNIIHLNRKHMRSMPHTIEYTDVLIPKEYSENVLVLKYRDIYRKENDNYVGYEKLKQFTNCIGNSVIAENYKNYVLGRDKFLSTHLHWIKNEIN